MKPYTLVLCLVLLAQCRSSVRSNQDIVSDGIIHEGHGFDSFDINTTTADDVIKKLGTGFDKVKHKEHSVQMRYTKIGVSFYYYQDDDTKGIFSIVFSEPFKGKTSRGIILEQSTMQDVARLYGEPDWTTCEGCDNWTAEYDGIQFSVERDKSVPQFPLNEPLHLKKKIIEIEVTNE